MLRPLDLAVNCRIKRDHHLLRLEFSSTTAPTGYSLFLQKPDSEVGNSCNQTTAPSLSPPGSPSTLAWHLRK
ncbi:hypothetical protein DFAR_3370005 [Desulfarculales bacterium]